MLQVPIVGTDPDAGTVTYRDPGGRLVEQSVLGGQAKLQWRPDWAMRWAALEVDYEMYGKDLIDSAKLSGQICRILGGTPPAGFAYEMFLDERGQKISKSKGNGLTCDEWFTYGTSRAWSCSCIRRRARPSGSISTSSHARSTTTSACSIGFRADRGAALPQPGLAPP